jgi:NAD(P)-dependent dehydrogenase (short-subunit alcohol dehydrogenase family)
VDLDGCSILVTGGGSGLGRATARELSARGAVVTVLDLGPALAEPGPGEKAWSRVAGDVTSEADVQAALRVATGHGPLRGLVHCAGRGGDRLRIVDRRGRPGPLDSFEEVLRINLVGTYNVLRLAAAEMAGSPPDAAGGRGACVLTASVAAFDGQIGQASYAASKAAVHGLTLVAARDLAEHGIRVNTIAPGVFDTAMLARLRADLRETLERSVPHPSRLGDPAEYAHLAASVLENDYLNGETIRLDGSIRMQPR